MDKSRDSVRYWGGIPTSGLCKVTSLLLLIIVTLGLLGGGGWYITAHAATTTLGNKAIGDLVKININGTPREFIVVHHGKPSYIYDDSFNNGTILLMKNIHEKRQWHSYDTNDYANSTIHSYLNGTFLNLFDQNIKDAILQVKIPYRPGSGTSETVSSGSLGLQCKIFLPAQLEVSPNRGPTFGVDDGATWSYFAGLSFNTSQPKRVAYLNSTATNWWLRSPNTYNSTIVWYVSTIGDIIAYQYCSFSYGIRPALVLPSSLLVSDDGSIIPLQQNVPYNTNHNKQAA